jgi:hypothetical protein
MIGLSSTLSVISGRCVKTVKVRTIFLTEPEHYHVTTLQSELSSLCKPVTCILPSRDLALGLAHGIYQRQPLVHRQFVAHDLIGNITLRAFLFRDGDPSLRVSRDVSPKDRKHRRGRFIALHVGVSHGQGQKQPGVLKNYAANSIVLGEILEHGAFHPLSKHIASKPCHYVESEQVWRTKEQNQRTNMRD